MRALIDRRTQAKIYVLKCKINFPFFKGDSKGLIEPEFIKAFSAEALMVSLDPNSDPMEK